ncbi:hypothetical protein GCM10023074_30670 [Microbispora amethystogenes]|uniref:Uncharacterized protein n=1 Tax=Microbispora amethystogenes TaxID=1427754 RepID=A0ABQ4FLF3_9ACTN|nr:hypothetical protein Mam01_58110 [Microbispora amethystogenes]
MSPHWLPAGGTLPGDYLIPEHEHEHDGSVAPDQIHPPALPAEERA